MFNRSNMSKICAKCSKSVYPLEELKCLDKTWHKGCFRCWECNMTLNMKNYKGYDKKPYCSAHYPRTKATVVVDTPELQRLARNTEIQSQVKYHEEFEKKIKGSKIQISDDPETQRIKQVSSAVSQVEYKAGRDKTGNKESRRQSLPPTSEKKERWPSVSSSNSVQVDDPRSPYSDRSTSTSITYSSVGKVEAPRLKRIGSIADYDPVNENYGSLTQGYNPVTRSSQSQEWEETVSVSPSATPTFVAKRDSLNENSQEMDVKPQEPTNDKKDAQDDNREPDGEDVFNDDGKNEVTEDEDIPFPKETQRGMIDQKVLVEVNEDMEKQNEEVRNASPAAEVEQDIPQDQKKPRGLKETHGDFEENLETKSTSTASNFHKALDEHVPNSASESIIDGIVRENADGAEEGEDETEKSETEEEDDQAPEETAVAEGKPLSGIYAALYDYEKQDDDEVGFIEGDQIVSCESVDDGWMIGTVARTKERGMLPANYVEQVI